MKTRKKQAKREPEPANPDNLSHLRGWFLVATKGNAKLARKLADEYYARHLRKKRRQT